MGLTEWFNKNITPIIESAIKDAVKEEIESVKAEIVADIKAELGDLENRFANEFDEVETQIVGKIGDAEQNVLGNFSGLVNQFTNLPEQIINGVLGKLPHFPTF